MKEKVVVGMSGGVDSSAAALLLLQKGYEVIGVTMQMLGDTADAQDAAQVAKTLGIPHYVVDFREEFRRNVMDYFIEEYRKGRTPNPCIACNRYVKWEALLKRCHELGADYIATGHYARIKQLPGGRFTVCNSVTAEKDQTYALYNLTQEQLSHTLMPVGDFTKEEIRQLALTARLPVAHKPDSQDICFVPDGDYAGLIGRERPEALPDRGNFVTAAGEVLGEHKGIIHYTVGQRKGLGLAMGHPVFVTEIRPETNEVVIGEAGDVFTSVLTCHQINYMGMEALPEPRRVLAKIRYAHRGEWCTIEKTGSDEITCRFEKPVRAVTPGQAVVFYEEDYVLGGGSID